MQIKNVAGIRFASGRAAQQQRNLPVRDRVLREVVVDDQRVHPLVAEILAHCAAGVGRDILHRGGVGGGCGYDNRVFQSARLFQRGANVVDGRRFLPDRDIDAHHVAAFLIDNGVEGDSGFADSPVADDQFALPASNRHEAVHCFDARLKRLLDRLPVYDSGRGPLDESSLVGDDRAFAVNRVARRADDAPQHRFPDGNFDDAPGALHGRALANLVVRAKDNGPDVILFEVQGQGADDGPLLVGDRVAFGIEEFQQFRDHALFKAVDAGDSIAYLQNGSHALFGNFAVIRLKLALQNRSDLFRSYRHVVRLCLRLT